MDGSLKADGKTRRRLGLQCRRHQDRHRHLRISHGILGTEGELGVLGSKFETGMDDR